MKLLISTIGVTQFYRCGRKFTSAGAVFDDEDFTKNEAKRIDAEPRLRVREATSDEIAADASSELPPDGDLVDQVSEIVQLLDHTGFGKDGKPLMASVRENLADGVDPKLVNRSLLHGVMTSLIDGGFEVPTAPE